MNNGTLLSGEKYLNILLDAFPSPVIVVDAGLIIQDYNQAAADWHADQSGILSRQLCGDFLHCTHARNASGGCGTTIYCEKCALRQTTQAVIKGDKVFRHLSEMYLEASGDIKRIWLQVSGSLFDYDQQDYAVLVLEDVTELIQLRKIIPVCMYCRKIRVGENSWTEFEAYVQKHTASRISHGICPACAKTHYPDIID